MLLVIASAHDAAHDGRGRGNKGLPEGGAAIRVRGDG